jgi:hypothetical protein
LVGIPSAPVAFLMLILKCTMYFFKDFWENFRTAIVWFFWKYF